MGIKIKQTVVDALPTGEYPVKIAEIKQEQGQFGEQLRFRFDVTAPGFEDRSLTGWTSTSFSNKSKLYAWTRAAFGGSEIPRDWDFDSDKLLGRDCVAVVLVRTADDGSEFNKLDTLKPLRQPARPAPPVRAAPAPAARSGPVPVPGPRSEYVPVEPPGADEELPF